MKSDDQLAASRGALRAHVDAVVGTGELPRFDEALTHASYANETGAADNQRLEFLGDAVLGLCVSELLSASHPDADEGRLTRMRSALVNAEALAAWARRVGIGPCIALGRGATLGTEREQSNVLADAAEALVAAVYDARGIEGARALVFDMVREAVQKSDALATPDPKSALQERVQAARLAAPTYRIASIRGAGSDQIFVVEVLLDGRVVAQGEGRSKRVAERAAAATALERIS